MELPIVAPAPIVAEHAVVFRDLFDHQCQFRHVQHDLTELIVLPNKSLANIARCMLESADNTNLSRFLSEAPWREDAVHRRRIRFMLQDTTPHRRRRRDSLVVIDDTLCEHVGNLFDDVDRHDHHGGTVPPAIPARTVACGPTIAIIVAEVRRGERPLGRRGPRSVEALQWRLTGLHVWLTGGRHPTREDDGQGPPPAGVLVQDTGWPQAPWPTAAGTDRHHPTVARCDAVRWRSDEAAQTASSDPPAQRASPTQEDPLRSG